MGPSRSVGQGRNPARLSTAPTSVAILSLLTWVAGRMSAITDAEEKRKTAFSREVDRRPRGPGATSPPVTPATPFGVGSITRQAGETARLLIDRWKFMTWAKNKMPMVISLAVPSLLRKAGCRDQSDPSRASGNYGLHRCYRECEQDLVLQTGEYVPEAECGNLKGQTQHQPRRNQNPRGRGNKLTAIEDRSRPYLAIVSAPIPEKRGSEQNAR
jgi:hypothetical protein